MTRFYKVRAPKDLDPNERESDHFEILGKDGITYTGIFIDIRYNEVAPTDYYKF